MWSSKDASKDPEEKEPLLLSVTDAFEEVVPPLDPPVGFEDKGAARGGRSMDPTLLCGERARGTGRGIIIDGVLSLVSPLSPEERSTTRGTTIRGQGSPSVRGSLDMGLNLIFAAVPLSRSCSLFLFEASAR